MTDSDRARRTALTADVWETVRTAREAPAPGTRRPGRRRWLLLAARTHESPEPHTGRTTARVHPKPKTLRGSRSRAPQDTASRSSSRAGRSSSATRRRLSSRCPARGAIRGSARRAPLVATAGTCGRSTRADGPRRARSSTRPSSSAADDSGFFTLLRAARNRTFTDGATGNACGGGSGQDGLAIGGRARPASPAGRGPAACTPARRCRRCGESPRRGCRRGSRESRGARAARSARVRAPAPIRPLPSCGLIRSGATGRAPGVGSLPQWPAARWDDGDRQVG